MAIKEFAPDMAVKKDLISFDYHALGKRYKIDSFVNYMGGTAQRGKLSLGVRLSSPPGELKAVGISRKDLHQDSPIPQAVYVESLTEKYGPPTKDSGTSGTGMTAERTVEWLIGKGTVQCLPEAAAASADSVLDRISRNHPNPTPEFLDQCVSMMRYVLRGEPVIQANAYMADVPAAAKAELETQAWIQSLIDEKSSPGTDKPRL